MAVVKATTKFVQPEGPAKYIQPNAIMAMAKTTMTGFKSQARGYFAKSDPNGVNMFKCLVLGYMRRAAKPGKKAPPVGVFVLIGEYTKADLQAVVPAIPPHVARWNDKLNCIEMNIRMARTKSDGPLPKDSTKYFHADPKEHKYVPLRHNDIIEISDFGSGLNEEIVGTFCSLADLRPVFNPPKADADANASFYREFNWKYEGCLPQAKISPWIMPQILSRLPSLPFIIERDQSLTQAERRALILLNVVPSTDMDSVVDLTKRPTWALTQLLPVSSYKDVTWKEKDSAVPKAPDGTDLVITPATIPDTHNKKLTINGMVLQKEHAYDTKVYRVAIQLQLWAPQVEEIYQVKAVDLWLGMMSFVHLIRAQLTTVLSIAKTQSAMGNLASAGADSDSEDSGTEITDAPLLSIEHQPAASSSQAPTVVSAPAAPAKVNVKDLLKQKQAANKQEKEESQVQVAAHYDGSAVLSAMRGWHSMKELLQQYGFRITHSWPFEAVRTITTRVVAATSDPKLDDLEVLPAVVCVSQCTVDGLDEFSKLVEAGKGEFRVLPECEYDEVNFARIKDLTVEQSMSVLNGDKDAPFVLTRSKDPVFVIFYINNLHNPQKKLPKDFKGLDDSLAALRKYIRLDGAGAGAAAADLTLTGPVVQQQQQQHNKPPAPEPMETVAAAANPFASKDEDSATAQAAPQKRKKDPKVGEAAADEKAAAAARAKAKKSRREEAE